MVHVLLMILESYWNWLKVLVHLMCRLVIKVAYDFQTQNWSNQLIKFPPIMEPSLLCLFLHLFPLEFLVVFLGSQLSLSIIMSYGKVSFPILFKRLEL